MSPKKMIKNIGYVLLICLLTKNVAVAQQQGFQMKKVPRRADTHEGQGQFNKLIVRGAMMIDGTGAPPIGPVSIIVKKNKIAKIKHLSLQFNCEDSLDGGSEVHVIDACGMYVTPGFVDVHDHMGQEKINGNASYVYKLWLAHGITAVKGVPFGPTDWSLKQAKLSQENKIVAPRLIVGVWPPQMRSPKKIREWVDKMSKKGITLFGEIGARDPEQMEVLMDQAKKDGIWTMDHLDQEGVVRMNAARSVKLGLDEVTHFYGIFESMLTDHSIQDWPIYYNYSQNLDRFSRVGRLYRQSAEPGSKKWKDLIQLFLKHHTVLSPTFTIYSANRNVMNARNADWWNKYTLPSLWKFIAPNRNVHASYFWDFTSRDEAAWQQFFTKWMKFVYDYNNAGGRVTVGEDTAFLYELFGFGYIKGLKMLEYAGLTPFEVLRSATLYGAESIFMPHKSKGKPVEYGIIRPGLKADLQLFTRNPLKDFNLLYGTGAIRLNRKTNKLQRVRILKYVIKDGIIYDPAKLLKDVRQMVQQDKQKNPELLKKLPNLPKPMLDIPTVLAPANNKHLYYKSLSKTRNFEKVQSQNYNY
jgi:hypothetical protein